MTNNGSFALNPEVVIELEEGLKRGLHRCIQWPSPLTQSICQGDLQRVGPLAGVLRCYYCPELTLDRCRFLSG